MSQIATKQGASRTPEEERSAPVTGILDVRNDHAFIRTSGYLPGSDDVHVSPARLREYGLRAGDQVEGIAAPPKNAKAKRRTLARADFVNGRPADASRPAFADLTPDHPDVRLRLETNLRPPQGSLSRTTRIIDLVAPIGKGQRGLIVAPPKTGKTMVLQSIAAAITENHPECHLMVLLVDERPEEVTDMRASVRGEIFDSTFDRPPGDHVAVAELAIERAKRLVEEGGDVVVLLDSITRLGRAYNLVAPAGARIQSGGLATTAIHPPKRVLGAARNAGEAGSLTILATALVDTGSRMDDFLFEEFKGTGNMELRLDRGLADRRIFPAVDVTSSGTRREELLLDPDELRTTWKLRRALGALDPQRATELLLDRIRETSSNAEFLRAVTAQPLDGGRG